MGDLGVILFILYMVLMKKGNRDRSNSDLNKLITKGLIGFFVLGIIFSSLDGLLAMGILGASAYFLYKKLKAKKEAEERAHRYGWDPQRWDKEKPQPRPLGGLGQTGGNRQGGYGQSQGGNAEDSYRKTGNRQGGYSQSQGGYSQGGNTQGSYKQSGNRQGGYQSRRPTTPLPKLAKKRRKILADFNQKYELYLTDEQMSSIVNSSYMSEIWRHELEDMNCKYDSIYQWFTGPTNWLRVYMFAFHVQEITSDIQQQEDICMYAFESIFSYVDTLTNLTLSQKIRMVNEKFFTSFDDVSFMVAYRFLERKGLIHDLTNPDLVRNSDSAEDLVNQYMNDEKQGSQDLTADDLVNRYLNEGDTDVSLG